MRSLTTTRLFLSPLDFLVFPFIGTTLTEDAPFFGPAHRASAVQPPDLDIENAREGNPDRERCETPSRHPIEPIEGDHRGENELWRATFATGPEMVLSLL